MLRFLAQMDRSVTPAELARGLRKQPSGGHWNNGMAILRRNNLILEQAGRIVLRCGSAP